MRAEITNDGMGFSIRLSAGDRRDFGHLLNLFKDCVAENCRQYDSDARLWRVEKRASRGLETFIATVEGAGAKIVMLSQPRHVQTLEMMAAKVCERSQTHLIVSDRDNGGEVLRYRAKCKVERKPAIVVTRHNAWASLRATVYGGAMKDAAKRLIFDYLMASSSPGGSIRVSNREIVCTRVSVGIAAEMAAWLNYQLCNEHNIEAGNLDGHEHARLEATKRSDGSFKMRQGAQRRAA